MRSAHTKTPNPGNGTPREPQSGPYEQANRFTRTLTPAEPRLRRNPHTMTERHSCELTSPRVMHCHTPRADLIP